MSRLFNKPSWAFCREHPVFIAAVLLAACFIAYLGGVNRYAAHRAGLTCRQAMDARTTSQYRAWLRASGEPWHESPWGAGSTAFDTLYPAALSGYYACHVLATNESIKEVAVEYRE